MPSTNQIEIPDFHHPRSNLSSVHRQNEPEDAFVSDFLDTYLETALQIHRGSPKTEMVVAREVAVNGLGIADALALSWKPKDTSLDFGVATVESLMYLTPTIRAFEAKLVNWRKGMMQAHRYSFFADASILVVPAKLLSAIQKAVPDFRKLSVGLWIFDQGRRSLRAIYTPRPRLSSAPEYRRMALKRMADAFRAQRVP